MLNSYDISLRALNVLEACKLKTVDDLKSKTVKELMAIDHMTKKTIEELKLLKLI